MTTGLLEHLASFGVGVLSGHALTIWQARRLARPDRITPVSHTPRDVSTGPRRAPVLITVLLVAGALLLALGLQQIAYQRQASERDACYQTWGEEVIDTINVRTGANTTLATAQQQREDAVDAIQLVTIALRARPPRAVERDLDLALDRFAEAKRTLDRVRLEAEMTRNDNPYPVLRCR